MSPTAGRRDGVQAREASAGTPSSFVSAPASDVTLATLEFPAALEQVAGYAAGGLGAAAVRARRPLGEASLVRRELALVAEGLDLLASGDGLEPLPVPDLTAALDRLRVAGSVLDGADLLPIRATLAAARQIARELRRVEPRAPGIGALAEPVPDRAIEQRLDQSLDDDGGLLDGASPGLAAARREVQGARERLVRRLEAILRHADPQALPQGAAVTVRAGRYVIPVRRDSRARPTGLVHDESGSAGTLFIEPTEAIELGNALREAITRESREVLKVLRELTDLLRPHREVIRDAHAMCVCVDDLAARARYAHAVGGAVPEVGPAGGPLVIRNGRHPLLLARAEPAVPFDLSLDTGERTLLVSGPNAGGKTVLLKAVGVSAALVQAGVVPPVGDGSTFPVFTRFHADIGDHQSIAANLSTFSAHVAFLREVLTSADGGTLVLLDELGSGTDPAEGAALGWATLEALGHRGARTLATTHLGALKTFASELPGLVHGSLEFDAATLSPTYRFTRGVPGRSYGIAIARRLGVEPDVIARAETHVPEGERALDALLHDVQRREQTLRERERELAMQADEAAHHQAELTRQIDDVTAREQELHRRERDADRRARAGAREHLLEARRQVEAALAAAAAARTEDEARAARRMLEGEIGRMDGGTDGREGGRWDRRTQGPCEVDVGARVRLSGGGAGVVEEFRTDGKAVVRAGTVRLVVPATSIEAAWPPVEPVRAAHPSIGPSADPSASLDLDLRGMRVDEAEAALVAAVDAAILADQPFLRVIHGKGTGALRDRVHEVLHADRRVPRFALAPAHQGGSGVTMVEFGA